MAKSNKLQKASEFSANDPIARLIVHYFQPCEFVREEYIRTNRKIEATKKASRFQAAKELTFLRFWLASLHTVTEGYRELKLSDDEIDGMLMATDYLKRLRIFRNGSFHYQRNADKLAQIFTSETPDFLAWADNLHKRFSDFASRYRIEITVKNLIRNDADASK